MKNKILYLAAMCALFFGGLISASASDGTSSAGSINWVFVRNSFLNSKSAVAALIFTCVVIVLGAVLCFVFRKKFANSKSKHLVGAFIAFYSVFGIGCLALAFATDGVSWSNILFREYAKELNNPQFSDYINTVCEAGEQNYGAIASQNTPFACLVFFLLSKFLPRAFIIGETILLYSYILRNQTFMYLYLILTMLCIVLIYRMNRSVLRKNNLRLADELVAFLAVMSYPTMYAVERGNIIAISLVLSLFFIVYHNSESTYVREMSHIALGVSAAITPTTILFLVLMSRKDKKSIFATVKIICYSAILILASSFIVGFDNLLLFIQNFAGINAEVFVPSNMSIANLMLFLGVDSKAAIVAVTVIMNLIAMTAAVVLPETWQKLTAIVYIMLNLFATGSPVTLIFIFVPFVFLLSKKEHKAISWLYLLFFVLLVTPFPEWFYYDSSNFNIFMSSFGISNIQNANNLISLASVQSLFVVLLCQTAKKLFAKKVKQ